MLMQLLAMADHHIVVQIGAAAFMASVWREDSIGHGGLGLLFAASTAENSARLGGSLRRFSVLVDRGWA